MSARVRPFVALALLLLPAAAAQMTVEVTPAAPDAREVVVLVNGIDIEDADSPGTATLVDPRSPANLSLQFSPQERVRIRHISVGLVVSGPGSAPPPLLTRTNPANSNLDPGFTNYVNTTLDVGSLEKLGAGVFLMRVTVLDNASAELYDREFYVRVPGGAQALLTAQGAVITALSVATGYGLWQVLKDLKETRDAWERHRKRRERARLDVIGAAEYLAEEAAAKAGRPVAALVDVRRAADDAERSLRPVRWAATGLGLGGVGLAWAQFLGYVAFDALGLVFTALEGAAALLTLALVGNVLLKKWRARREPAEAPAAGTDEAPPVA